MKQFKYFLLLVIGVFSIYSCQDQKHTEGEIIYNISYPEYDKEAHSLMYTMLPKEQVFTFKDNDFKSVIKKAFVEISMNVNTEKEDLTMFFNFNKGSYVNLTDEDKGSMLASQPSYKIEFKNEEKIIAGLNAKKAIATDVASRKEIELWYTTDIAISNANWFNPFKEVPGVLLQYSIENYGLFMQFTAEKFEEKNVTSEQLDVTNKDNKIEYSKMIELLESSLKEYQ